MKKILLILSLILNSDVFAIDCQKIGQEAFDIRSDINKIYFEIMKILFPNEKPRLIESTKTFGNEFTFTVLEIENFNLEKMQNKINNLLGTDDEELRVEDKKEKEALKKLNDDIKIQYKDKYILKGKSINSTLNTLYKLESPKLSDFQKSENKCLKYCTIDDNDKIVQACPVGYDCPFEKHPLNQRYFTCLKK